MTIIDPHLLRSIHFTRLRHAGVLADEVTNETVFQTSTISALLDGAYEGDVTFRELARHGDFGIGTLQQLDGEMIALDGTFYVARVDGQVSTVSPDARTPFAVVVPWRTDARSRVETSATLEALTAQLDRLVPPDGNILAVRVDGHFPRVLARSVPKQFPPYATLSAVAAQQVVFEWFDLDATLVGFRCPASVGGYDLVGYHWHVLSNDRRRGGHVLDCTMTTGRAAFHRAVELHVEIPNGLAWHAPQSDAARNEVLKKLEGIAPSPRPSA
jgi:acetolactate decarboxylase